MSPKKLRPLFTLFLFFTLSFLTLVALYQRTELDTLKVAREREDRGRIKQLGETVRKEFERNPKLKEDPYLLHLFAEEVGVKQILLIESNGRLLVDSTRETEKGETVPLSLSLHKASEGEAQISISHEKKEARLAELLLPFKEDQRVSVIRVLAEFPTAKNPNGEIFLLLIKLFGLVGGGILGYYALRGLWAPSLPDRAAEGGGGLLNDAVQEAVRKLKLTKEAAQARADTMENYNENIIQSMPSGLVTFDRDGKVITVNPAAEAILGVQRDAVLDRGCEALFGANTTIPSFLKETLNQEKETIREECELTRPDGKKIWLGMALSILRDQKGGAIGSSLFFIDLTARKTAQEQAELNKRLAMMGEISAWIAHEFRNYMGTIMGYTGLLAKEFERDAPPLEMTRAITRELATMERLITDLLSYGKRPSLILQRIAFTSLVEEVLDSFRSGFPDVQFLTAFEACEASADPVLVRQAVSNLIRNGIEAMEGKGALALRLAYLRDGSIEMKIADTGRGIPDDQIDKIFLPFYTTREKGSGLGLALVHKIILSHNGTLSVESQTGKGTTFTVTLPSSRF